MYILGESFHKYTIVLHTDRHSHEAPTRIHTHRHVLTHIHRWSNKVTAGVLILLRQLSFRKERQSAILFEESFWKHVSDVHAAFTVFPKYLHSALDRSTKGIMTRNTGGAELCCAVRVQDTWHTGIWLNIN